MAQICFKDSFIIVLYRAYPRRFKLAEVAPDTRANVHFFGIDNFAVLRRFFFKRGDCCGRFLLRKRVYNQHFRSVRRFIRVPPLNLLFLFLRKHNGGTGLWLNRLLFALWRINRRGRGFQLARSPSMRVYRRNPNTAIPSRGARAAVCLRQTAAGRRSRPRAFRLRRNARRAPHPTSRLRRFGKWKRAEHGESRGAEALWGF